MSLAGGEGFASGPNCQRFNLLVIITAQLD